MTGITLEGAVTAAKILIRQIDNLDVEAAPSWWELGDLSASMVYENGGSVAQQRSSMKRLHTDDWAEQIGWTEENGKSLGTLKQTISIARSWPEEYRVESASFWMHKEALTIKNGSVKNASRWLASKKRPSVRDTARSGVSGTGPIYDAIRALARARAGIVRVPAILAKANALGTEPNFGQLRDEVKRLKRGMNYLDRYLADETAIDMDEFQAGLDKILKEAS